MSHHYSGPDFGFPHGDARLDLTDLYAFPKPGEADKSILIMNVHPSAVVNPPGSTTRRPSGLTVASCLAVRVNLTVRCSPRCSATRSNPSSARVGPEPELT